MCEYILNVDGVVVRDDEYLLIKRGADEEHAPGILGFPGGTVEAPPNEDRVIEKTARRELYEEVGLEVGDVEYVHSNTFEMDTGSICLNVLTVCEYDGGEPRAKAEDEVDGVYWMTSEEAKAHDSTPEFTKQFIELVEDHRTNGDGSTV